ncbi:PREDICTED: uncharacterized protein LOC109147249 isoform X1 [Ipomoea nil]|uniref:uncharacterized protein LOC109147249 isoform X1 n=1 Tax=Ipomoea nil TaxID=35883 RepID=UPI000901946D|nr:PREDICTED: uncharacterized protein LOC109147249 isoform X1 [Ipomoea nil]
MLSTYRFSVFNLDCQRHQSTIAHRSSLIAKSSRLRLSTSHSLTLSTTSSPAVAANVDSWLVTDILEIFRLVSPSWCKSFRFSLQILELYTVTCDLILEFWFKKVGSKLNNITTSIKYEFFVFKLWKLHFITIILLCVQEPFMFFNLVWRLDINLVGNQRQNHYYCKGITCLAFSMDGSLLVSGSEDGTIRVWDTKNHNITRIFGHGKEEAAVAEGEDGR